MLVEAGLRRLQPDPRFHPDAHAQRVRAVERQFRFLRRFLGLRKVFLDLGAGDCALARRVSGYVERVYAVDVSGEVARPRWRAGNVVPVLCDGLSVPVPAASADVAFISRFLRPVEAGDAPQLLASLQRAMAPGGRCFCMAPPAPRALLALLLGAGFREVRFHALVRGVRCRVPVSFAHAFGPLAAVEAVK